MLLHYKYQEFGNHHEAGAAVAEGRGAVRHLQRRRAVQRLHEVAPRDVGVLQQALVVLLVLHGAVLAVSEA